MACGDRSHRIRVLLGGALALVAGLIMSGLPVRAQTPAGAAARITHRGILDRAAADRIIAELSAARTRGVPLVVLELAGAGTDWIPALDLADRLLDAPPGTPPTVTWATGRVEGSALLPFLAADRRYARTGSPLGQPDASAARPDPRDPAAPRADQALGRIADRRGLPPRLLQALLDPDLAIKEVFVDGARRFLTQAELDDLLAFGRDCRIGRTLTVRGEPFAVEPTAALDLGLIDGTVASAAEAARLSGFARDVQSLAALLAGRTPLPHHRTGKVVTIPVEEWDEIDLPTAAFIERCVRDAKAAGAELIVLEIDTPGGGVAETIRICQTLDAAAPVRTVAHVIGTALSAGSLIATACDRIYMREASNMGSAAPVTMGSEGMVMLPEKVVSAIRAEFRKWAQKKGRNEHIAQAFADEDVEVREVWVDGERRFVEPSEIDALEAEGREVRRGRIICEKGKLLNLTAREAVDVGYADGIAETVADLARAEGIAEPEITPYPYTAEERVTEFLYGIRLVFLVVGLIGLYIEFKVPGFGVPGIIGIAALLVFFGSSYMVGVAQFWEIALFFLGAILVAAEVFVIPGFGVAGVAGAACMFLSLILAMQPFAMPDPNLPWQWDAVGRNLVHLSGSILAAMVIMAMIAKVLPRTSAASHFILEAPTSEEVRATGARLPADRDVASGATGKTVTALRPAGKAMIDGRLHDVVTLGDYLEPEVPVRVVTVEGNRIVVEHAGEA